MIEDSAILDRGEWGGLSEDIQVSRDLKGACGYLSQRVPGFGNSKSKAWDGQCSLTSKKPVWVSRVSEGRCWQLRQEEDWGG